MSYPQPPGMAGFPAPPAVAPEPRASPGTAITAGVLAALGGVFNLFGVVSSVALLGASGYITDSTAYPSQSQYGSPEVATFDPTAIGIISLIGTSIVVLTLISGCILLFMRKGAGRILVACGSGTAILAYISNFVISLLAIPDNADAGAAGAVTALSGAFTLILTLPAIATLVLVLVPPTGRWIRQGKNPAGQPQQGFPQQGFPQQMPQQGYPQQMSGPGYYQQQQWW